MCAWMVMAERVRRRPRAPSSCASCPARRNTRVLPICQPPRRAACSTRRASSAAALSSSARASTGAYPPRPPAIRMLYRCTKGLRPAKHHEAESMITACRLPTPFDFESEVRLRAVLHRSRIHCGVHALPACTPAGCCTAAHTACGPCGNHVFCACWHHSEHFSERFSACLGVKPQAAQTACTL